MYSLIHTPYYHPYVKKHNKPAHPRVGLFFFRKDKSDGEEN
jgi:hypothetical protein